MKENTVVSYNMLFSHSNCWTSKSSKSSWKPLTVPTDRGFLVDSVGNYQKVVGSVKIWHTKHFTRPALSTFTTSHSLWGERERERVVWICITNIWPSPYHPGKVSEDRPVLSQLQAEYTAPLDLNRRLAAMSSSLSSASHLRGIMEKH